MSLLSLPVEIRQKIFAFAGLKRSHPFHLLGRSALRPPPRLRLVCFPRSLVTGHPSNCSWPGCPCNDSPIHILLVCRQFHDEGLPVLYGQNNLLIHGWDPSTWKNIFRIPPSSLGQIRSLQIQLNCSSDIQRHEVDYAVGNESTCRRCREAYVGSYEHKSITLQTGHWASVCEQWDAISTYLSQHLAAGKVHLALIADVVGIQEAQLVTKHLRKLPVLKGLDLRLGHGGQHELREIAAQTFAVMTGKPRVSFPFERLPVELQLRVLEFTDLAPRNGTEGQDPGLLRPPFGKLGALASAPFRHRVTDPARRREDYECNRSSRREQRDDVIWIRENKITARHILYPEHYVCCRNCTLAPSGCFCQRSHASVSAYCLCRQPCALFYVSKRIHQYATQIFYSQNIFVFDQSLQQTSSFLEALKPSLTQRIRHVVVHPGPSFYLDIIYGESSYAPNVRRLFEVMIGKLNLRRLSFTLDMGYLSSHWSHIPAYLYMHEVAIARSMRMLREAKELHFRPSKPEWASVMREMINSDD